MGPVTAHIIMTSIAVIKAYTLPVTLVTFEENLLKKRESLLPFFFDSTSLAGCLAGFFLFSTLLNIYLNNFELNI